MKPRSTASRLKQGWNRTGKYVAIVTPILMVFVLFAIYPNISVLFMSLYKWSPISSAREYVGTHNFKILFTVQAEQTWSKIFNTVTYILGLFVIQTLLSLGLALALQKNTIKNKFFRAFFFLPMVFSSTMISMTWAYMYDPNLGIINNLLGLFDPSRYPGVDFFTTNFRAIILIVVVHIWANIGYPITILISGINSISGEIKEAAIIDGANGWQAFFHVTLPLLLPTLLRLSLLTITTGAMTADYVVMVGSPGSSVPYETMSSWMYKATRSGLEYGMVSATATVMFVVLALTSLVQFLAMRKVEKSILG